jgi:hypothetical protein
LINIHGLAVPEPSVAISAAWMHGRPQPARIKISGAMVPIRPYIIL